MDTIPRSLAIAAGAGTAAYLNAKFHIWHDLTASEFATISPSVLYYVWSRVRKRRLTTYHVLQEQATEKRPDQVFLIFEGKEWTYRQFFEDVNRIGNWLYKDLGVKRGEVVALNGPNTPEHLMIWIALDGLGAVTGLINNNLTGEALHHCVKISGARYMLYDEEVSNTVRASTETLKQLGVTRHEFSAAFVSTLTDTNPTPEHSRSELTMDEPRSLIYTSGTTGLPKAVTISTIKELMVGYTTARTLRLKPTNRIYTCMPLYHGAAHGLCASPSIHAGSTIVLGRKFSHKTFWPEVRSSKANILQYVGELCRYLVNAPPDPRDKDHSLEMAWGNGMRPDVWEEFRNRFGVPVIHELYAATDGAGATFNFNKGDFTKFAIGRRGIIWRLTKGRREIIVRCDGDTGEIVRDENGFAVLCDVNEPGQVLHKLNPQAPDALISLYYNNHAASAKRRERDVLQKGDLQVAQTNDEDPKLTIRRWFTSGDMMRQDKEGRVYFVDRLGDTFRWHSENVSTNEVSDTVGLFPQVAECNAYGVEVPRSDGRCGCAAIVMRDGVDEKSFDYEGLARHVMEKLPRYAVPIFLRVTPSLEYTGSLKIQKVKARSEGADPEKIAPSGDKLFWLPPGGTKYVPFPQADYERLKSGAVRL